jgi:hypothetical protein
MDDLLDDGELVTKMGGKVMIIRVKKCLQKQGLPLCSVIKNRVNNDSFNY